MKTYQKIGLGFLAVVSLTACGSSSSSPAITSTVASTATCVATATTTCVNGIVTSITGTTPRGTSYPITVNGVTGTETLTSIFPYADTLTGNYNLPETVTVYAGDKIEIQLANSPVLTQQPEWYGTWTENSVLNNFHVLLNGTDMYDTGSSMYGVYSFPAAGNVTFTANSSVGGTGTHYISYNGTVLIAHCVASDGSAMTCPLNQ